MGLTINELRERGGRYSVSFRQRCLRISDTVLNAEWLPVKLVSASVWSEKYSWRGELVGMLGVAYIIKFQNQ